MAKGLTEKQRKILEYIIDFQKENGFPPTIRELGDAFQIGSLRGVTVHLDALVRKGFMTRERTSRSIRIVAPDPREADRTGIHVTAPLAPTTRAASAAPRQESATRLPLVRRPAALPGSDKLAIEGEVERYVTIPEEIAGTATDGFVIRVGATGVHGEPILPGDLLVVRPQRTASTGELVVSLSHGDMTVGRAAAPTDPSAVIETGLGGGNELIGRVVALIRRY
jgi:repressor LexA